MSARSVDAFNPNPEPRRAGHLRSRSAFVRAISPIEPMSAPINLAISFLSGRCLIDLIFRSNKAMEHFCDSSGPLQNKVDLITPLPAREDCARIVVGDANALEEVFVDIFNIYHDTPGIAYRIQALVQKQFRS